MNIVFLVASTFPYYTGGIENWLYNICNKLSMDNNVIVISEKPCKKEAIINGTVGVINDNVKLIQTKVIKSSDMAYKLLYHSYMVPFFCEIEKVQMYKALKKVVCCKPNELFYVVSLDTIYTGSIGAMAKKNYKNVKFINSVRGPHAELTSMNYPLLKRYFFYKENDSLRGADQVWANGWDTAVELGKRGYESIIVRNGVDCSRIENDMVFPVGLKPIGCEFYILTIGTVYDVKGYRELVSAIAILKHKYNLRVGLTSFGKGNPTKYVEQARKLNVEKQIMFAGVQTNTIEYGKYFDCIACLSGGSGLSMACLESMATGVPVVAWDSAVYKQLIENNVSGVLVKEKDEEDLAEGINWILNNRKEAAKIGLAGQIRAREFDWRVIVEDIINSLKVLE